MSFNNGNELLTKEYCNQFDCKKLIKIIKIFMSLIQNMQMELGDVDSIRITQKYEMKYSDYVPVKSSSVESFWINDYKTEQQMKECISKFTYAYNSLSSVEKEIFYKLILNDEKESTVELKTFYRIPSAKDITHIKQSAIIKFCTFLKFHRIIDKILT